MVLKKSEIKTCKQTHWQRDTERDRDSEIECERDREDIKILLT